MTKVISFASGKGGVGKTFLTAAFSAYLARAGYHVLAADGDMGLRNLDLAFGVEEKARHTILELAKGQRFEREVVIPVMENLDFLPASPDTDWKEISRPVVETVFDDLDGQYDYILLDCPAGMGKGIRFARSISDLFVLVMLPARASRRDAFKMHEFLGDVPCRFLLNRFSQETASIFVNVLESMGRSAFGGVIPEAPDAARLGEAGKITSYEADSHFGKALGMAVKTMLGKAEYPRSAWQDLIGNWRDGSRRMVSEQAENEPLVTRLRKRQSHMAGRWKWKGR